MKRILYFIADPTVEQIAFAKQHNMAIRNPLAYSASDYLEPCDAVYGEPPQVYLDKFPLFELPAPPKLVDVNKLKIEELKALLEEKGIPYDPNAKKDVLMALLQEQKEQE